MIKQAVAIHITRYSLLSSKAALTIDKHNHPSESVESPAQGQQPIVKGYTVRDPTYTTFLNDKSTVINELVDAKS